MLMLSGVKMRLVVVVGVVCLLSGAEAKSSKKSTKDETSPTTVLNKKILGKAKPQQSTPPAIIAIEIVDPNENKTSSNKNSKRTIDQSLGYGYQKIYGSSYSPPRYQVYKYSQHDIPAYRGNAHGIFTGGIRSHHYDFQKSVSYNLPSHQHQSSLTQYYQPGTTLFSTINNDGQVGGLSSHLPQISQQHHQEPQVPVIILRVLPSQLNDPSSALHPNLPSSHPLAAAINSIDIQSLLSKYVQNTLIHNDQSHQQEPNYQYQQYEQQPQYHYQQQANYQGQHESTEDDGLLTHENYPKETHTRVIFRTDKNKLGSSSHVDTPETKTIQVEVPTQEHQSYSSVEVQTPDMQYSYSSQGSDSHNPSQQDYYNYYEASQKTAPENYYYNSQPESSNYQAYQQQYSYDDGSNSGGYQYQEPQVAPAVEEPVQHQHVHQKRSRKGAKRSRPVEEERELFELKPIRS